jgi:hypothetical protein
MNNNSVQVFGLPRSGTNLLEYMIRNYFNIEYNNLYKICDIQIYNKFKKINALKHSKPFIDNNKIIIIYKEEYLKSKSAIHYFKDYNTQKNVFYE